jgi:hypothetical protein
LAREDRKISFLEDAWREAALEAARNLVNRYEWALKRRAELRRYAMMKQ